MLETAKKRFVVITGASQGLGFVCTKYLLDSGWHVFALSRSCGRLADIAEQYSGRLRWIKTDIARNQSVTEAFATISAITPVIHGLVLNAASTTPRHFDNLGEADIERDLAINIAGPIYCLQGGAPLLSGGRAIFVSSESVTDPYPMLALYAGAKAATEVILAGIRHELYAQRKITLTVLRSGFIEGTAFGEAWTEAERNAFQAASVTSGNLGRSGAPMPARRVAEGIGFLLNMAPDAAVNTLDIRSASAY